MTFGGKLTTLVTVRSLALLSLVIAPLLLLCILSRPNDPAIGCPRDERTSYRSDRVVVVSDADKPRTRTILYWTKMFSSDDFYFGSGDIFASCPIFDCLATSDRTSRALADFDALMFHGSEVDLEDLPWTRSPRQRYIFMDVEAPIFHPVTRAEALKRFFNWTMTYRRDSDVVRPYGVVRRIAGNELIPPDVRATWRDVSAAPVGDKSRRSVESKTKPIAWFVSNCETRSGRELYVERLKRHVAVDTYGACGTLACDRADEDRCMRMVESDYYFYLAFENSLCRQYITEKVFKFLEYDVVPIVYGAGDYAGTLPPGSYIDVSDFRSPRHLADHLAQLVDDRERYLEYFRWKSVYRVETRHNYTVCELCRRLHKEIGREEVVVDAYHWMTDDQCWSFDGKTLGID